MRFLYVLFVGIITTATCLNAGFKEIVTPNTNIIDEIIDVEGTVYAGVHGSGIFRSTNKGNDWVDVSPQIGIDRATSLCYDGTTMYASFYNHGIYKTENGGTNWSMIDDEINDKRITSLICNNESIFAATDGYGVFASYDRGETWEDISSGLLNKDVSEIVFFKDGLLAATKTGGLYIIEELEGNWKKTDLIFEINDIEVSEEGTIYVATDKGAYVSIDDAENWEELSNIYFNHFNNENDVIEERSISKIIEFDGNIIIGTNDAGTYFLKVEDNNVFWDKTNLHSPITALYFDSNNGYFAADINGEFYNKQQISSSWAKRTQIKAKIEYSIFKSSGDNMLYAFADNGIGYSSSDLGTSWEKLPELDYNQLYDIAGKLNNSVVLATDNGLYYTLNRGNSWSVFKAEGNENNWYFKDVENNNSNNMFASLINGSGKNQLLLSNADFSQWNDVTDETQPIDNITTLPSGFILGNLGPGLAKSENYGKTFAFYPEIDAVNDMIYANNRILAIQTTRIFSSDDGGFTFRNLNYLFDTYLNSPKLQSITANQKGTFFISASSTTMYGNEDSDIFKSTSNGISWEKISMDLPQSDIRSIYSDNKGNLFASKSKLFLFRDSLILELPQILKPTNEEYAVDRNPLIILDSIDNNAYYEIEFSDDDEFINIIERGVFSGDKYQVSMKFAYNTKMYFRLRNRYENEHSEWLSSSFTTKLIEPSLRSPVNNSKNTEFEIELKWYPSNQAESYRMQISESNTFDEIVYVDSTENNLIITDELESSTQYFWRVRAENDGNISDWSQIWNFTTKIGPPVLIYPETGAANLNTNIELIWEGKEVITGYLLQISTINTFDENNTDEHEVIGSEKQLSLEFSTQYFWRVASMKDGETSDWSETFSFTTGFAPVELTSPEDNAINVEIPVMYEWTVDSGADKYEIMITEIETGKIISDIVETNSYSSNEMDFDQEYSWKVRSLYGSTNSSLWSEEFSFYTLLVQPELISPENDAEINAPETTLKWKGANVNDYYHLMISQNSDFTEVVSDNKTVFVSDEDLNTAGFGVNLGGQEYFWRVRTVELESDKTSEWSETWRFYLTELRVELFQPEDNATEIPEKQQFIWYPIDNAIDYTIQINIFHPLFDDPDIEISSLTKESVFIDELKPNTIYYWRVIANTEDKGEIISDYRKFTTGNFTSVNDAITAETEIDIYPNPAKQDVSIKYPNLLIVNKIEVYDITGNKLVVIDRPAPSQTEIDISNLVSGQYYLKVFTDKGATTKIFTIAK